jgi:hypothetical protein
VSGIFVDIDGTLDLAIGDGSDPHPRSAVFDLIGQALAHEASAYDSHANRFPESLSFLKCVINEYHVRR